MQIGYNNDVEYRDETFHIQTEDRGEGSADIETQIFHSGAILDTSIVSYQDVLDEIDDVDERIAKIRQMMKGNHKKLYKRLFAGEYDEMVGLEPIDDRDAADLEPDFEPEQQAVPAAALQVERGEADIEDLIGDQPGGESVSLDELQAQLNRDAEKAESASSKEPPGGAEGAPTLSLDAGIGDTIQTGSVPRPAAKVIDFPETGAAAWTGCEEGDEDLDITEMVEEFVG